MPSYRCWNSHCKDKTVSRLSYLYNGNQYTWQGWGEYYSGTRLAQNDKHEYAKNIVLEYYSSTDFPVPVLVCSVLAPVLIHGKTVFILRQDPGDMLFDKPVSVKSYSRNYSFLDIITTVPPSFSNWLVWHLYSEMTSDHALRMIRPLPNHGLNERRF